jgi:hypothetical protein
MSPPPLLAAALRGHLACTVCRGALIRAMIAAVFEEGSAITKQAKVP